MLRGCLLALLLYAALAVGYFFWLDTVLEPPTSYWAAALVGLVVFFAIGALLNVRSAYRDWSLIAAARRGLPPQDGRLVAVSGTIHPLGEPLVAPFSGEECVICEYDLSRQQRKTGAGDKENSGSDFTGFLMTPCVIRTSTGDVPLLGYPVLEGWSDSAHHTYAAARRAIDFLTTREFEDRSGLRMVTLLSIFGDLWSDEDGRVEKNIRIGGISLPDLFPPELEAEIDRQTIGSAAQAPPAPGAEPQSEIEEDKPDDEFDDEEFDDDEFDNDEFEDEFDDEDLSKEIEAGPGVPQMTEKRVKVGQQVCAIGRYDQMRGGLIPSRGSPNPNRLVRGSADALEAKSKSALRGYLTGGLIALAAIHAVTFLVLKTYPHSAEVVRHRQEQAFAAAQSGDIARLQSLVRRGMDIDIRQSGGATPLMVASDPAVVAWLIAHGADVNAVDDNGQTALMQAASSGHIEIVRQLIDAGADLDRRSTNWNRTALLNAVDGGHEEVAALLRQAGAADDVVSAEAGQPLAPDGGEPLAAVQAYLDAIRARDPAALGALFRAGTTFDFADVDWDLWHNVRPVKIESWTGFSRGDDATITVTGASGRGISVTWEYQLRRDSGQWRIAREKES